MVIVTISEHHKKFKKSQIVMHFVEKSAVWYLWFFLYI